MKRVLAGVLLAGACLCAMAEKADRDKPVNVESDHMFYDDRNQTSTFTGNVILTKGTIEIRGDKLVVRQDAQGNQYGTATGNRASFRQKREGLEEWMEGQALQIDYDGAKDTVLLQRQAEVRRVDASAKALEEVHGNTILYESGSEFYTVEGGRQGATAANPSGRVRVVIQPRPPSGTPAPASPTGKPGPSGPSGQADRPGPSAPVPLKPAQRLDLGNP